MWKVDFAHSVSKRFLTSWSNTNGLLPKSLFAWSKTFFDKSEARSRRCQNSPFGLKQLTSLILRFAKIY